MRDEGPDSSTPHAGRGVGKSLATDVATDVLTRCRASQRKYRNTLLFVAADEAQLGTARESMRRLPQPPIDCPLRIN